MEILDNLRSILESRDFLDDFRKMNQTNRIVSDLFKAEERASITPQGYFLITLIKHAQNKLREYQVFLSITLTLPENPEVKKILQEKRETIKKYLCGPTYGDSNPCIRRKHCLEDALKNTEFDVLIVADGQSCILEYENTWEGVCHSLAMAHRVMAYGPRDRFAWLFAAPIRSKVAEKKLENYVEGAKLLFDGLINRDKWAITGLSI